MLHNKYHIQGHFSGILEDDFIITEQTEETTLTSTPSHLNYGIIGICTNGNATIHLYNKKHIWVKDELIILLPHQLCALDNESADFTACYIMLPRTLYGDILSYFRHFDANFHFFMQDHFHYDLKLDDDLSTHIILEIKSLLRDSRLNIQQIAILTNFSTQSALNRFFRQYTGMTLTMYRKNIYQL